MFNKQQFSSFTSHYKTIFYYKDGFLPSVLNSISIVVVENEIHLQYLPYMEQLCSQYSMYICVLTANTKE